MVEVYSPMAALSAIRRDNWIKARVIQNDAEALTVANELAAEFRQESAARDRERRLPGAELDRYSGSGLWALTVPREFGDPNASRSDGYYIRG
jgi:alkylation response protein AidB-like acyl-CoA dehydrogenase